ALGESVATLCSLARCTASERRWWLMRSSRLASLPKEVDGLGARDRNDLPLLVGTDTPPLRLGGSGVSQRASGGRRGSLVVAFRLCDQSSWWGPSRHGGWRDGRGYPVRPTSQLELGTNAKCTGGQGDG